jgi:hypothetical protein
MSSSARSRFVPKSRKDSQKDDIMKRAGERRRPPKPYKLGQGPAKGNKKAITFERLENDPRIPEFLESLTCARTVKEAAESIGVCPATAYNWRNAVPEFAAAWDEAVAQSISVYEEEMYRRGIEGWDEGVFYQGKQVGTIRQYSDRLLEFRAKRIDPGYRDQHPITDTRPPITISIDLGKARQPGLGAIDCTESPSTLTHPKSASTDPMDLRSLESL